MCALEIIRYQHKNSRFNLLQDAPGRNTSTMSDRTAVENTEEKEKGRGEGDEKDQIDLLSFQPRSTQFIFPRLFALSLITGTFFFLHTMTIPPDCSAVHILMMGAMPMVVPWK